MEKIITITNGTGTGELINGEYSVTANVPGYDNTSISPSSINATSDTNSFEFTISATGTLTLHVTEEGTAQGTPIVGATFVRTDSEGTEYGEAITTDSNGDAVFNCVPFAPTEAPTIYFKQTASDGEHEFDNTVQNTTMSTKTLTLQIQNVVGATRTITLSEANYANLPIQNGTITLSN